MLINGYSNYKTLPCQRKLRFGATTEQLKTFLDSQKAKDAGIEVKRLPVKNNTDEVFLGLSSPDSMVTGSKSSKAHPSAIIACAVIGIGADYDKAFEDLAKTCGDEITWKSSHKF